MADSPVPYLTACVHRACRATSAVHLASAVACGLSMVLVLTLCDMLVIVPVVVTFVLVLATGVRLTRERAAMNDRHDKLELEIASYMGVTNDFAPPRRTRMTGNDYWRAQSPERVYATLMAMFRQDHGICQILAAALGYSRSDGGPDDPNGGDYAIGDHTSVSLANEAARKLRSGGRA